MKKRNITLRFYTLLFIACVCTVSAQSNITWKSVRIGGGGFVTSMKAHPKVKDLYFITTDVGTPYRWNSETQAWEGLLYDLPASDWDREGAGDLAVDPNDEKGNILYITLSGLRSEPGTVLKSTDRGTTWVDCKLPIEVWSNSHKGVKRLAVDPQNSNVVYLTTCSSKSISDKNGMFKSSKAGEAGSWEKINDLYGRFIEFDTKKCIFSGVSKGIYIGCEDGVYQSTNAGKSFKRMPGSPVKPNRSDMDAKGVLYVTSNSGLHKWDGKQWEDITPPTPGKYSAIAVNPNNNLQLVCSSNSFNPYKFNAYRSNDGGKSWTHMPTDETSKPDLSEVPWYDTFIGQNLTEMCWDPFDQNMVWFTDFFFPSQTKNIWATPYPNWKPRAVGEEETVSIGNLLCPPAGDNLLITSIADAGGWDHKSLVHPPKVGMQKFFPWKPDPAVDGGWGNMTGSAVQETNPNFIARVGRISWRGAGYAGYSLDGGETYTQFNIPKDVAGGRIAISASNETLLWIPQAGIPQRSTNRGENWQAITSLPTDILTGENVFSSGPVFPLAADKVNGAKFYVYNNTGGMYVSSDNGISFSLQGEGLPESHDAKHLTVETTPGIEGDVWVGMIMNGLYHSTNSGKSFVKVDAVQEVKFLAIGKSAPNSPSVSAVYVLGTVDNIKDCLFRSNDNGLTWENLGKPTIGKTPLSMAADRRVYGRVFIGTGGNGFFYSEEL